MIIGYAREENQSTTYQQISVLEKNKVDKCFCDTYNSGNIMKTEDTQFQKMLKKMKKGDTLVIPSLDNISRNYKTLIVFLKKLETRKIKLKVLNLSIDNIPDIISFLEWTRNNEKELPPKIITYGKEKRKDAKLYRFNTKDPEAKQVYKEILGMLIDKMSVREIANITDVPKATIFRIKQNFKKVKTVAWISMFFLITIISLKISQRLTQNLFLQLLICLISTAIILYMAYRDSITET